MSTYHHGDLRAAVLAAAGKLIEKEGLAGISVREAARRAGVSHNAPYRHFSDRNALLDALVAEGFRELKQALDGRSGRELGEAYVRFALERPERFRLMFRGRPAKGGSPDPHSQAQATFGALQGTFASVGADAEYAAAAAWALVHGLAYLILDGHLEKGEDFARRVIGSIRIAVAPQRSA